MPQNSLSKKASDRYQPGREEGLWNVKIYQAPGTDWAIFWLGRLLRKCQLKLQQEGKYVWIFKPV